jgi:hypothetical protein
MLENFLVAAHLAAFQEGLSSTMNIVSLLMCDPVLGSHIACVSSHDSGKQ